MEKKENYSPLWKRTSETQEKMSKNENAIAVLLLNVICAIWQCHVVY